MSSFAIVLDMTCMRPDETKQVSCKHAACLRNNLYMNEDFKKQKCGPLFEEWKKCFDAEVLVCVSFAVA
jgi:hypothetical protein